MKKFLLLATAAIAGIATMNADTFNANDWVLNAQAFNKVDGAAVSELSVANNVLTATVPATEAKTLSRFEFSSTADIKMGAGENVLVMKVEYVNCKYSDFDANSFSLVRQLFNGDDNKGEQNAPYFTTDANKLAGRMASPNSTDATTAYYWRDMAGGLVNSGACDFAESFTIYGNQFTPKKFTVGEDHMYGRCWVGVRFAHSNKNEEVIGADAAVKISYIGVTSLAKLGVENSADLKGSHVKAYIEATSTGVSNVIAAPAIAVRGEAGAVVAEGARSLEVYTLSGVKVAEVAGTSAAVAPGLYIVKATNAETTTTSKVYVK